MVVQRFENKSLAQEYLAIEAGHLKDPKSAKRRRWQVDSNIGPRFKEDVVWHGTRLKRSLAWGKSGRLSVPISGSDGDATLAHKLLGIEMLP